MKNNRPDEHLNALLKKAEAALQQAEEYAKTHDMEFSFDIAYGMGGTFRAIDKYDDGYTYNSDGGIGDFAWFPSSQSC